MEIDNLSDIFGDFDNEFLMSDQDDIEENFDMFCNDEEIGHEEETTESLDELTSQHFLIDESFTFESHIIEHHKSLNSKECELRFFGELPNHNSSLDEDNLNSENEMFSKKSNILFENYINGRSGEIDDDDDDDDSRRQKSHRKFTSEKNRNELPKYKPIIFDLPQENLQNGETTNNNDDLISRISFESQKLQSSKRGKNTSNVMSRLTFLNGSDVMSRVSFIGTGDVMSRVSYVRKDMELFNDGVARVSYVNDDSEPLCDISRVTSYKINYTNIKCEKEM